MSPRGKVGAVRPFIKWAGGKGQLLDQFRRLFPPGLEQGQITQYSEPFLGGGAVFFDVASRYRIRSAHLSDVNPDLVLTYQVVRDNPSPLVEALRSLSEQYAGLGADERKAFFLEVRKNFNLTRKDMPTGPKSAGAVKFAACIIFLNRTCFNGLYRVNKKGEFNVPFGSYSNPTILDEPVLRAASECLAIAEIKTADFAEVLARATPETFVYFDPPYRPISRTSSFTSYSTCDFDDNQQRRLAEVFAELDRRGACVMLSNSDPHNVNPQDDFFDDLYRNFKIHRVSCRRAINAKSEGRGEISEIVVTNYAVENAKTQPYAVHVPLLFGKEPGPQELQACPMTKYLK